MNEVPPLWPDHLLSYASQPLEERKQWYTSAAAAYDQWRPRYSQSLVDQALAYCDLKPPARLLEVGCGPGTATVAFAPYVGKLVALEPNPETFQRAVANCRSFPQVTLENVAFEEWPLTPVMDGSFDVVLAATSFHWIPAATAYPKAALALREGGSLLLLWNNKLEPDTAVYDHLRPVYQRYAPQLDRYQDVVQQAEELANFGTHIESSGYFEAPRYSQEIHQVRYPVADYLQLLSTYSPYIALEPEQRQKLFMNLAETLLTTVGDFVSLTYVSAFHWAPKRS